MSQPLSPDDLEAVIRHARMSQHTQLIHYQFHPLDNWLDEAIAHAEADLLPAGREKAAEGMKFVARMMGIGPPPRDVLTGYAALLGELPADLLAKALRQGVAAQTWRKLPLVGSFLAAVAHDMAGRRERLSVLRFHKGRVQFLARTRPPAEPLRIGMQQARLPSTRLRKIEGG